MPAKSYIPKAIKAFQFNPKSQADIDALGKLGIDFNDDKSRVSSSGGNELDIAEGDYILLDADNNIQLMSKDNFERRYQEYK